VFVYAFESDRGPYIVDAGWNTDDAFAALGDGLSVAGFELADVRGVLVTHIHPDHYGLAGRVREVSGAWVALHPADAALVHSRYRDPAALLALMGQMLQRAGAPPAEIESLQNASMPVLAYVDAVEPDVLIEDGDKPEVPGWDLSAIWTPGHSPGHVCFYEPRYRLMLSGDHVLPRITPNVSLHPQAGSDPLGDYLRSLAKMREFESDEVLPAHEHRFVGLDARVDELVAHHEQRFLEVIEALRAGVTTVWGVAEQMRWSRPWNRIEGFMRRAALSEAAAHLRALEARGVVREIVGEPSRFELLVDS
jgi:glyoxylase-like metal-dependent hydrolase (beta-lactamase superfamily II)